MPVAVRSRGERSRAEARRRTSPGFPARSRPSRSPHAGSRRPPGAAPARARTKAAAGAACGDASWATDREKRRGCRQATRRDHVRDHLDGVVLDDPHVGETRGIDAVEEAPTPGPCTSSPTKSSSGWAAAMVAVVSPMPKPISRTTGARRPNTPRSRAAPAQTGCRSRAAACRGRAAAPGTSGPGAGRSCGSGDARGSARSVPVDRHCAVRAPYAAIRRRSAGARRFAACRRLAACTRRRACCRPSTAPARRSTRIRLPAQRLADAIARDLPHRDLVVAVRGAEIGDGDVLPIR